jgi:hypothetical protein
MFRTAPTIIPVIEIRAVSLALIKVLIHIDREKKKKTPTT